MNRFASSELQSRWSRWHFAAAIVSLACLVTTPGLRGEDFIRGDANGDGEVTAADAQYALSFMFLGLGSGGCLAAMDAQFHGTVDITDAIEILRVDVGLRSTLCAPYPDPGVAPGGYPSDCESYGGGEPIDVSDASVEVLDATADASGQVDLQVILHHDHDISLVSVALAVEGDIFVADRVYASDFPHEEPTLITTLGEELRITSLQRLVPDGSSYPAGEDVLVASVELCLDPGTPAGSYDMTIVRGELSSMNHGQAMHPRLAAGTITVPADIPASTDCSADELVPGEPGCEVPDFPDDDPPDDPDDPPLPPQDFVRGDVNTDGSVSMSDAIMMRRWFFMGGAQPTCLRAIDVNDDGGLDLTDQVSALRHIFFPEQFTPPAPYPEIGPDATPSGSDIPCDAFDVVEPEETSDTVRLGDVTALPGDEVTIPVHVTSTRELDAFQLVVRYDPAAFEPIFSQDFELGTLTGPISLSGSYYEGVIDRPEHSFAALSQLDEETFILGFIPNFIAGHELPAGEDILALNVRGRVPDDAETGTTVMLEPTNELAGSGPGIASRRNEFTYRGQARFISIVPRGIPGELKINADIVIFRGDANDDGKIDISDPTFLLSYLFLGTEAPRCPDAADANDDGEIDISDAIAILSTEFLGQSQIAAPYPSAGPDATSDRLARCRTKIAH